MMAIQMPNLTSYSGSWLMWYADRTAREAGLAPVAPPVAHRKVDPKYIAAAAAAVACWRTSRSTSGRMRKSWAAISLGCAAWAVAAP